MPQSRVTEPVVPAPLDGQLDLEQPGAAQPVELPASGPPLSKLQKIIRWGTKGGLAVLDQGLISASNFLMGILLGRWLEPAQYGAYALAFSILMFLLLIYQALVLEPMAVFSGGAYHKSLRGYLRSLLAMHVILSLIIASVLGIAAFAAQFYWKSAGIPGALAGVTLAAPCILLFWLARRSYYMEFSPARAAAGAGIYFVLVAGGILLAARLHHISAFVAYALMAAGALVTSLYLLWHLRASLSADTEPAPTGGEVWRKHWAYGRWAIATQLANWVPYYMYYPVLTQFQGVAAAGSLRALMNLSLPMEQTCTALSILFLPMSARRYKQGGAKAAAKLTERITALFVGGALVYWFLILPFRPEVMNLLYKGKYLEVTWLIPWLALGITLWAASFGPAIILRSMEDPSAVFYARAAATILSVLVGVPLTWKYGLLGVMISLISANAASFVVTRVLLSRKVSQAQSSA